MAHKRLHGGNSYGFIDKIIKTKNRVFCIQAAEILIEQQEYSLAQNILDVYPEKNLPRYAAFNKAFLYAKLHLQQKNIAKVLQQIEIMAINFYSEKNALRCIELSADIALLRSQKNWNSLRKTIDLHELLLSKNHNAPYCYFQLGMVYFTRRQMHRAIKYWEQAGALDVNYQKHSQDLQNIAKGYLLYDECDFKKALEFFAKVYEKITKYLDKALKHHPDYDTALFYRDHIDITLFQAESDPKLEIAKERCEKRLEEGKDVVNTHILLARYYSSLLHANESKGNAPEISDFMDEIFKKAKNHLEQALKLEPHNSFKKAKNHLEQALKLEPHNSFAYTMMGYIHQSIHEKRRQDFALIMHYYNQAIIFNPNNYLVYLYKSLLLYKQREFAGLRHDLGKLKTHCDKLHFQVFFEAVVASRAGEYSKAEKLLEQIISLEHPWPHLEMGILHFRQKNWEKATKYFKKIIPDNGHKYLDDIKVEACIYLEILDRQSGKENTFFGKIAQTRNHEFYLKAAEILLEMKEYGFAGSFLGNHPWGNQKFWSTTNNKHLRFYREILKAKYELQNNNIKSAYKTLIDISDEVSNNRELILFSATLKDIQYQNDQK